MMSRLPLSLSLLVLVSFASLAGCGEPEVKKADVESIAQKQLTATVGKEAPPITCPENLKAVVGTKMACGMDLDGKTHDVNVTVTSVEGENVKFDIAVADQPR